MFLLQQPKWPETETNAERGWIKLSKVEQASEPALGQKSRSAGLQDWGFKHLIKLPLRQQKRPHTPELIPRQNTFWPMGPPSPTCHLFIANQSPVMPGHGTCLLNLGQSV